MARISIEELITVLYTNQHQDIEDAIQTLYERYDISKQTGEPLKEIGKIVGVSEYPTDTDELRAYITAQIGANNSEGTFPSVYAVWKTMSEAYGGTKHKILPAFPQELRFTTDATISATVAAIIVTLLNDTVSTEVAVAGILPYTEDGDGVFKFDSTSPTDGFDVGVFIDYL